MVDRDLQSENGLLMWGGKPVSTSTIFNRVAFASSVERGLRFARPGASSLSERARYADD